MRQKVSHGAARWLPAHALRRSPQRLRHWLTDAGSLTAHLKARCQRFELCVLREGRFQANEDERRCIGLARGRNAWVREVWLIADGVPVVFAHSVAHPRTLRGPWRMARTVGGKPLGAALFADPRIARGKLQATRIAGNHPLHRRASSAWKQPLPALWGRRSNFERDGHRLLVTEVFLPALADLLPSKQPPRSESCGYRSSVAA